MPAASVLSISPGASRRARPTAESKSAFTRRSTQILRHATEVFCDKGYEGASMRDLSRCSGVSLAGLYHYFESKEELLYAIQKQTFTTIVRNLREGLQAVDGPELRIRIFIQNHLQYFLANQKAMKVLSHEADVLKNGYGTEVAAIKREYYRICLGLVEDLRPRGGPGFSTRIAVLSLFGMMNWIYTWHNPRADADAGQLARQMGDIFLGGVMASPTKHRARNARIPVHRSRTASHKKKSTRNKLTRKTKSQAITQ